jgi:hypothetical protein
MIENIPETDDSPWDTILKREFGEAQAMPRFFRDLSPFPCAKGLIFKSSLLFETYSYNTKPN